MIFIYILPMFFIMNITIKLVEFSMQHGLAKKEVI